MVQRYRNELYENIVNAISINEIKQIIKKSKVSKQSKEMILEVLKF